jgi:hypothetical protein
MWIGDIDVPQPVLDAAEAGKLVIFVGAGASRSHPSSLPDFAELVRDIGALVGREPTDEEVRHPDVFLGRLQDHGNDVHQLVARPCRIEAQPPSPRDRWTGCRVSDPQNCHDQLRPAPDLGSHFHVPRT